VDTLDIALRLGAATLVGAVLGLNRDLHGKPTGVRTLGLVCLGSALAVLSIQDGSSTDASRIVQGIMTGVGFLGAGVIVRNSKGHHVHGLTTAACVWVTACIGAACAVAEWQIVVLGAFLVLVILVFGGPSKKQSTGAGRAGEQPTRRRAARRGRDVILAAPRRQVAYTIQICCRDLLSGSVSKRNYMKDNRHQRLSPSEKFGGRHPRLRG
jgi:putative Mg2+ transporter-C (MgtC) family protein